MVNHILLIDDDEDEHLFFHWSLEKLNINVTLLDTYSADQGQEIIRRIRPDIIFLDINLPVVNGFTCLQQLKATEACRLVPVYMYSTDINDQSIKRAMVLGASGCLKKCRDNNMLTRSIVDILNAEPLLFPKTQRSNISRGHR